MKENDNEGGHGHQQSERGNDRKEIVNEIILHYRAGFEPLDTKTVGLRWFQERGLLRPLVNTFQSDPEQAFAAALETTCQVCECTELNETELQPLSLEQAATQNSEFAKIFQARIDYLAGKIETTFFLDAGTVLDKIIEERKNNFRIYGKSHKRHERKLRYYDEKTGEIKRRRNEKVRKGKEWQQNTFPVDTSNVIENTVTDGDNVLVISGQTDGFIPSLVKGYQGKWGALSILNTDSSNPETFFDDLVETVVDIESVKGYYPRKSVNRELIPKSFLYPSVEHFSRYMRTQAWYDDQPVWHDKRREQEFLLYWNMKLLQGSPLAGVSQEADSLNVIILDNSLSSIPEDRLHEFLCRAYRSLKTGGRLAISEQDPYLQAATEYYGNTAFPEDSRRESRLHLNHEPLWMIFEKETDIIGTRAEKRTKRAEGTTPHASYSIYQKSADTPFLASLRKQDSYTIAEIAHQAGVPPAVVRRRVEELGGTSSSGTGRVRSQGKKQYYQFTPEEAAIIIGGLPKK